MHFSRLLSPCLIFHIIQMILCDTLQEIIMKRKACYQFPSVNETNVGILDDILNVKFKPDEGTSIFFLMTSCFKEGVINLTTSQACAIESAAYHNPNRSVFVLFASPTKMPAHSQSKILDVLRSFTNIHFLNMDLDTFVKGTPMEDFYRSRKLFTSSFLVEHMSDFVRLLVLNKYGGIYLDTDAIVQKNLDKLPANFLGKEAYGENIIDTVNGAVLGFQDKVGHEILQLCFKDMIEHFSPIIWNHNGPALLTRVLEKEVCKTSIAEMTPEKCNGLKVFPPTEFYAVNFDKWPLFLDVNTADIVLKATENSSVIHLWNHHWRNRVVTKSKTNRKTAYEVIAEKNCPKVFEASGDHI